MARKPGVKSPREKGKADAEELSTADADDRRTDEKEIIDNVPEAHQKRGPRKGEDAEDAQPGNDGSEQVTVEITARISCQARYAERVKVAVIEALKAIPMPTGTNSVEVS